MANEKIEEYLVQHSTTTNTVNIKYDVAFFNGSTWETRFLTGLDLVADVVANVPTIYTNNGALTGNRL